MMSKPTKARKKDRHTGTQAKGRYRYQKNQRRRFHDQRKRNERADEAMIAERDA